MNLLIQGGRVIDPSQNLDSESDVLVIDGKISAIDQPGKIPVSKAERIVDGRGTWVLPGLIDVHVHLREPGHEFKETIESGLKSAAAGGFTTIACMANTAPVNDSAQITGWILKKASDVGLSRLFPIGAVTKGLLGVELSQIGSMVAEGARAISDDGMPVMNSQLMRAAMSYAKSFGVAVISHAEDSNLSCCGAMNEGMTSLKLGLGGNPGASEEIMIAREIALCRLTGAKVHIAHVSTKRGVDLIRRAKEEGLNLSAEVTPHHLTLTETTVSTLDANFKMAPPLRTEEDLRACVEGLASGVLDMIASDHAPHALGNKSLPFPEASNGIIGLQTSVPLTLGLVRSGAITLKRWVEAYTTRPAFLLGTEYGTLKPGAPADLTVLDPKSKWAFTKESNQSRSTNSPYLGWELEGKIIQTIVGGRTIYDAETRRTRS